MKCPNCSNNSLRIEVNFRGRVSCAFADDEAFELIDDVSFDSNWTDESPCECLKCNWSGTVAESKTVRI